MANATVEVRPYNFKRQETLDRGQLRHLTPMFETVSTRMAGAMTAMLHAAIRVEAGEIRQDSWDTFAAEVPDNTFIISSVLAPSGARIVLHLPLPLAASLIEIRLGGTGESETPGRPLTDIEQRLVDEVARQALAGVVSALDATVPVHVTSTTSVSNIQFLPAFNTGSAWLQIPLTVELSEAAGGHADLWIPTDLASALLSAANRDDTDTETEPDAPEVARVRQRLLTAAVEVAVRFPEIKLSTDELLSLTPGDVVPLRREQGLPLDLTIEGKWYCNVLLTARGRRLACTVADRRSERS